MADSQTDRKVTEPTPQEISEGIYAEAIGHFKKRLCCMAVEDRVEAAKAVDRNMRAVLSKYRQY